MTAPHSEVQNGFHTKRFEFYVFCLKSFPSEPAGIFFIYKNSAASSSKENLP